MDGQDGNPALEQAPPVAHVGTVFEGLPALARASLLGELAYANLTSVPIEWTWQDILPKGGVCMIAGAPGGGKTTLLFSLLAARATRDSCPRKILERIVYPAPHQQYVLLIEAEHSVESTAHKLMRACLSLGVPLSCLDRVISVARRGVTVGSPEWRDIETLASRGMLSDVAIDTLARVAHADANDEKAQIEVFERIIKLIDKSPAHLKPTMWITAHTRKGASGGLEDVSGSAQRTGQADTVLMVKARKLGGKVVSTRVTFEKLRERTIGEHPAPTIFFEGGTTNPNIQDKILDSIPLVGNISHNKLLLAAGCSEGALDKELKVLIDSGRVLKTVDPVGKVTRTFYHRAPL